MFTKISMACVASLLSCCMSPANGQSRVTVAESVSNMLKHAYVDSLPSIDRIELFLLDVEMDPATAGLTFQLAGEDYKLPVIGQKTLQGDECNKVTQAWRLLKLQRGGAFCHIPQYGIRFFHGDELLLETTLCWQCENFYLPTIDRTSGEVQLAMTSFGESGRKLLTVLNSLLPAKQTPKKPAGRTKR